MKISETKGKIIAVDLDGTLTNVACPENYKKLTIEMLEKVYLEMEANKSMIEKINILAEDNLVYIFTARDDLYQDVTIKWLKRHGVNYKYVIMKKPYYDLLVEDKAIKPEDLK